MPIILPNIDEKIIIEKYINDDNLNDWKKIKFKIKSNNEKIRPNFSPSNHPFFLLFFPIRKLPINKDIIKKIIWKIEVLFIILK